MMEEEGRKSCLEKTSFTLGALTAISLPEYTFPAISMALHLLLLQSVTAPHPGPQT